ncbi:glycoside hydrolase family 5 protein [Cerasicoccus fimbriatus]|uniref:glycoside hydrolase family 5 protein n=1 Tax=Cerasicoccus fimbriatus TaxID=3014554 RepID=UPI0022B2C9CD|nr:glycoside hydrolase family 5 protein [Cerasicoccus sp. TK19100]
MIQTTVPFLRAERFRRGINLSHWFSQVYTERGYSFEHFDTHTNRDDIDLIASLGFDHVRLPIACEPILAMGSPGELPLQYLQRIGRAISQIHDAGMAVMVDIHPETAFKDELARSDEAVDTFIAFWRTFASYLSAFDPEKTLLEILNEPCVWNPPRWSQIQQRCAKAIREHAPDHTLVVCGDQWSQLPQLLEIEIPDDSNQIINFHMYEPSSFTHQGAGWGNPWMQHTIGLTYPAEQSNAPTLLCGQTDQDAIKQLQEYIETDWNSQRYREYLSPAVALGERLQLPVICNEFGVYKEFCDRNSRLAWIHDVIESFERAGIGWTMWDYAGDFSILNSKGSTRSPDYELLKMMGLPVNSHV